MTSLAGEPLPVEFRHGCDWHPAVLVGWRTEVDGTCQVRVQFVVGGLRRTSWLPLTDVRLPEPVPLAARPAVPPLPRPHAHDDVLSRV
jgi:hypothetical protein